MNRLATEKRAQILGMLVEGVSMRAITRLTGVSIDTVSKLLVEAGEACAAYHDEHVREVRAARVGCDEIWSFVYAKAGRGPTDLARMVVLAPLAGHCLTFRHD